MGDPALDPFLQFRRKRLRRHVHAQVDDRGSRERRASLIRSLSADEAPSPGTGLDDALPTRLVERPGDSRQVDPQLLCQRPLRWKPVARLQPARPHVRQQSLGDGQIFRAASVIDLRYPGQHVS
jgi:hypothetical protein